MIGASSLPPDHYAVFRNLTKFAYVEIDDLFREFQNDIICKTEKGLTRVKVPKIELLKEKHAYAFCTLSEFTTRVRNKGLIKKNKHTKSDHITLRNKGIPQGSPISATLANIYLLNFDNNINSVISDLGGLYRRYSDDMVVVIDQKYKDLVIELLPKQIALEELEINLEKTQVFYFTEHNNRQICTEYNIYTEETISTSKFEYLGFSFDGENVYLKSSGLSKYYRKMKRSIRRGGFYAKFGKNNIPHLFKNRLYKKYTYIGQNRRKIFKRDPKNPSKFIDTGEYDWGNFLSYSKLAERIFKSNKIRKQTKNHWRIFHSLIKAKENEIKIFHDKKQQK